MPDARRAVRTAVGSGAGDPRCERAAGGVSLPQMRWSVLSLALALASAAAGCGGADCAQSADIQVSIAPNADVTIGQIVRLHVMLSIEDMTPKTLDIDTTQHPLMMSGDAFILRPDMTMVPAKYNIALTLQAFDEMNDLIAIGSESIEAVDKGCNRLTVHLAALPPQTPGPDMAAPPGSDLAGQMTGPDMAAACIGATPDEDNDGRANVCDLCPADPDPTPVDTDSDGLPDACDPDPAMGVNTLVYFEPFDTVTGHWSGNNPIMGSYINVDTGGIGTTNASNAMDMMPLLVRVQAMILPTAEHGNNGGDTGLFLGTSPNVNQATGVYCALTWNGGGPDTLDIYKVTNGGFGVPMTANLGAQISGTVYRLRLTQHAGIWTCEVTSSEMTTPVTVMTTQTVTAPLFITLENDNMGSHFHSIVAESKLP